MGKTLLVLSCGDLSLSFLFNGFDLVKLRVDGRNSLNLSGAIFKGKVKRLAKGMGGVFVDIGLEKEAYLPIKGDSFPKVGDWIMVQIVREPIQEKGARLSNQIKLIGKYMIYIPQCYDIKCSLKIDKDTKNQLTERIKPYLTEGGVILRTISASATEGELIKDIEYLINTWENIKDLYQKKNGIGMIAQGLSSYFNILTNHWYEIDSVLIDDIEIWNEVNAYLESFHSELIKKVIYIKDTFTYIKRYDIHNYINKVLSKYVWLRGGGYLVIEETEAFTAIDVNSGEPCGESQEENAVETNIEAAKEIAKQIILRDIGGIIVVDFIDMKEQENKEKVLKALQESFGSEACNVQIYGFTKLGLLEMVRRRSSESVYRKLSETCPYCRGNGRVKSKDLLIFELESDLKSVKLRKLEIDVNPRMAKFVKAYLKKLNLENVEVRSREDIEVGKYEIYY